MVRWQVNCGSERGHKELALFGILAPPLASRKPCQVSGSPESRPNVNPGFSTTKLKLSIYLFIYLWLYSPSLDLGRFFSFLILYTVGRTPWTSDQPVARPIPTYRTTETQNKCWQPCLEWDSNPRSHRSIEQRQFMPQTARPLRSARSRTYIIKILINLDNPN
jgi:hypothetical protein